MNDCRGMLDPSTRVALAALLHDLGKFAERARVAADATRLETWKQLDCPHWDGRPTHIHAAYTTAGFAAIVCGSADPGFVAVAAGFGLPALVCPAAVAAIAEGVVVRLDLERGRIEDRESGAAYDAPPCPPELVAAARRAQLLTRMRRVVEEEGFDG